MKMKIMYMGHLGTQNDDARISSMIKPLIVTGYSLSMIKPLIVTGYSLSCKGVIDWFKGRVYMGSTI